MLATAEEIRLDDRVTDFVMKGRKLLIGGKWVDAASGRTFPVYNPATAEVIAHVAEGGKQDIDRAVTAARRAYESGPWPRLTPSERGRLVWKLGDLILEHLEELAELESLDNGKPITVARAADVPLAADLFQYMAGWATKLEGIPGNGDCGLRSLIAYSGSMPALRITSPQRRVSSLSKALASAGVPPPGAGQDPASRH